MTDHPRNNNDPKHRLTRAEKRALATELGLGRPHRETKAIINARRRALEWRDNRHDLGLPDNRILGSIALQLLFRVDAEKRVVAKGSLDAFFQSLLSRLPSRFDRKATEELLQRYRDQAHAKLLEEQFLAELRVRRTAE